MYSINNFLPNNDCLIDLDNSIIICHLGIILFNAVAGFDKIMINDVIMSATRLAFMLLHKFAMLSQVLLLLDLVN